MPISSQSFSARTGYREYARTADSGLVLPTPKCSSSFIGELHNVSGQPRRSYGINYIGFRALTTVEPIVCL